MPKPPYNPKLTGEQAECAFTTESLRRLLVVSKPYGDSAPYDFIVDSGPHQGKPSRLLRVQVRSAGYVQTGWYRISIRLSNGRPLTRAETDFLVVSIPPHNAWYVIPVRALRGQKWGIAFCPGRPTRSRWERFRGAWWLLGAAANPP